MFSTTLVRCLVTGTMQWPRSPGKLTSSNISCELEYATKGNTCNLKSQRNVSCQYYFLETPTGFSCVSTLRSPHTMKNLQNENI